MFKFRKAKDEEPTAPGQGKRKKKKKIILICLFCFYLYLLSKVWLQFLDFFSANVYIMIYLVILQWESKRSPGFQEWW